LNQHHSGGRGPARSSFAISVPLVSSSNLTGSALPSCTGRELRPTHAASAAARLAGRGASNAASHVQIDALGIVPGLADYFVHTSPLSFAYASSQPICLGSCVEKCGQSDWRDQWITVSTLLHLACASSSWALSQGDILYTGCFLLMRRERKSDREREFEFRTILIEEC